MARHRIAQVLDVPVLFVLPRIEPVDRIQQRPDELAVDTRVVVEPSEAFVGVLGDPVPQRTVEQNSHIVDILLSQVMEEPAEAHSRVLEDRVPRTVVDSPLPQAVEEPVDDLRVAHESPLQRTVDQVIAVPELPDEAFQETRAPQCGHSLLP